MLILVSFFSAPSGISIDASPRTTVPPSSAEIRTSDFSSFTETVPLISALLVAVSASNDIGLMTEMYEAVIITAAILLVKLASTVFFELLLILFSCTLFILKSNPYRLARKILIICNYNSEPRPAVFKCNLF